MSDEEEDYVWNRCSRCGEEFRGPVGSDRDDVVFHACADLEVTNV